MSVEHRYPLLQQGLIKPSIHTNASTSITGTDSGKAFLNTGASASVTFLLPKAAPGLTFKFVETTAQNVVITPKSADAFRGLSAGVSKTLTGLGQNLAITCVTPNFWELF